MVAHKLLEQSVQYTTREKRSKTIVLIFSVLHIVVHVCLQLCVYILMKITVVLTTCRCGWSYRSRPSHLLKIRVEKWCDPHQHLTRKYSIWSNCDLGTHSWLRTTIVCFYKLKCHHWGIEEITNVITNTVRQHSANVPLIIMHKLEVQELTIWI